MTEIAEEDGMIITIGLTGNREYRVKNAFYPMIELKTLYLRVVVVDQNDEPDGFLIIRPDQIEYRLLPYSDAMMEAVDTAARAANEAFLAQKKQAEMSVPADNTFHRDGYG